MPVDESDVIQLLCLVMRKICGNMRKMKAACKNSGEGALLMGVGAVLGGLMGGRTGMIIGSALGGMLGGWRTSGQFKPVPQILLQLTPVGRQHLYKNTCAVVGNLAWIDMAQLTTMVMESTHIQEQLRDVIATYLFREFGAVVQYGN